MTEREKWLRINICRYCRGSRLHTCTGYDCREAAGRAGKAFDRMAGKELKAGRNKVKTSNPAAAGNGGETKEISRSPPG